MLGVAVGGVPGPPVTKTACWPRPPFESHGLRKTVKKRAMRRRTFSRLDQSSFSEMEWEGLEFAFRVRRSQSIGGRRAAKPISAFGDGAFLRPLICDGQKDGGSGRIVLSSRGSSRR